MSIPVWQNDLWSLGCKQILFFFSLHTLVAQHLQFVKLYVMHVVPHLVLFHQQRVFALFIDVKIYRQCNFLWLSENEWIHISACLCVRTLQNERMTTASRSEVKWCQWWCENAYVWYVIKNVESPSGCHLSLNNKNIKIMSFVYVIERFLLIVLPVMFFERK